MLIAPFIPMPGAGKLALQRRGTVPANQSCDFERDGANMKLTTSMYLMGTLLAGLTGAASADVITDWNEKAVAAGYTALQGPPVHGRIVAVVHLAMFEAVNSIEP